MVEVRYGVDKWSLDPFWIQSIIIISDITSAILTGELRLSDIDGTLAAKCKLGDPLLIIVTDSRGQRAYPMRVLSYQKLPADGSSGTIREVVLSLVSEWYFRQQTRTTCASFRGPISSIVETLIQNDQFFTHGGGSSSIEGSDDAKVFRYNFAESNIGYITRLQQYATKNGSPMLCYMAHDSKVHFKSVATLQQKATTYTLALLSSLHDRVQEQVGYNQLTIPLLSIAHYCDGKEASATRTWYFTTKHIQYTDTAASSCDLDSVEKGHTLVASNTPALDTTMNDWSVLSADGIAQALHQNFTKDLRMFYTVAVTADLSTSSLFVGDTVLVQTQENANTFPHDAKYVVKRIETLLQRESLISRIQLLQIR